MLRRLISQFCAKDKELRVDAVNLNFGPKDKELEVDTANFLLLGPKKRN